MSKFDITWRDVRSSTIARVGYDPARRVLAVVFRAPGGAPGAKYHYAGVPDHVHAALDGEATRVEMAYPGASVGKMFAATVRDKYVTTRVLASPPSSPLAAAIEETQRDHPLPRCPHGGALADGGGERLEPPCGCRLTTAPDQAALVARTALIFAEHGFRCAERGLNLEAAREEVSRMMTGMSLPEPAREKMPPVAGSDPFALSSDAISGGDEE